MSGRATAQVFVDSAIALDGGSWIGCYFDGCIMSLESLDDLVLEGNHFEDCQYEGAGWGQLLERGAIRIEPKAGGD
jgi:hypothetical protein